MATLSAIRFNPRIREFYQRLTQAGKPPMVAIVVYAEVIDHPQLNGRFRPALALRGLN